MFVCLFIARAVLHPCCTNHSCSSYWQAVSTAQLTHEQVLHRQWETEKSCSSLLSSSQTESWVEVSSNCGAAMSSSLAAAPEPHFPLVLLLPGWLCCQLPVLELCTLLPAQILPCWTHMANQSQLPEPRESQCC